MKLYIKTLRARFNSERELGAWWVICDAYTNAHLYAGGCVIWNTDIMWSEIQKLFLKVKEIHTSKEDNGKITL